MFADVDNFTRINLKIIGSVESVIPFDAEEEALQTADNPLPAGRQPLDRKLVTHPPSGQQNPGQSGVD